MDAYCVKCKAKVEVKNGQETLNAKGRRMLKGNCTKCNTVVCKILPSLKK
jgi:hypothetical protein